MPRADSIELLRLRKMVLIRRFEETVFHECAKPASVNRDGAFRFSIGGFVHLSSGQEAIAVGVAELMRPGRDYLVANVRHHGHSLALGMEPAAAMAELMGRQSGCCRGMGGSMHFFNVASGDLGGILRAGAQAPLGIGAAFSCAYRNTGGVCFILFGDGSINTGALAESLNLASLWKLPAVFVLENNGIAIGTSVARASPEPDLLKRGLGYAMLCSRVDGNDLEAVIAAAGEAAARARGGQGPSYIVADTYRFRGFTMTDAMRYRTKEERDGAKTRDPITIYANVLQDREILTEAIMDKLHEEVRAEVDQAVQLARGAADPPVTSRFDDLPTPQRF